jgi:uncharacterized protein with WD repeat
MNTTKKGFTRPNKKIDPKMAEDFISGAENKPLAAPLQNDVVETKDSNKKMPWDKGNEKIVKGYNYRMNEVLWLKLKFISENSPLSIQKIIDKAVSSAVDKELKKLLNV